jgi:hypothetical protein
MTVGAESSRAPRNSASDSAPLSHCALAPDHLLRLLHYSPGGHIQFPGALLVPSDSTSCDDLAGVELAKTGRHCQPPANARAYPLLLSALISGSPLLFKALPTRQLPPTRPSTPAEPLLAMPPSSPIPPTLLTLRLSSPSFLETILTSEGSPVYATETYGNTTSLSRCDSSNGLTLIANIHWPEHHSAKGKGKETASARLFIDGTMMSEEDLLKRNCLNT